MPIMNGKETVKKCRGFLNESSLSSDVEIDFNFTAESEDIPLKNVQCSLITDKNVDCNCNNSERDKSIDMLLRIPHGGYISYVDAEIICKAVEPSKQPRSRPSKTRGRCAAPKSYRDKNGNTVLLEAKVHIEQNRTIIDLADFSKNINRDAEPIGRYLLRALKATGAFLQDDMLMVLGVYDVSKIQALLNRLIELYVTCKRCKKFSNTSVSVVAKTYRLQCHNCEDYRYMGKIPYAPINTSNRNKK
ncbi:hypothetical protein PAEPH01_0290 [Pancytospora epiphaga]|nr:hypothetical protein PAEPH01_0290 [Pancytospora epiphaga]